MKTETIDYLRKLVSNVPPFSLNLPKSNVLEEIESMHKLFEDKDTFMQQAIELSKLDKGINFKPIGKELDERTLNEIANFVNAVILDGNHIETFIRDPQLAAIKLNKNLSKDAIETLKKIPDPRLILPKLDDVGPEAVGLVKAVIVVAVMAQLADKPLPNVIDNSIGNKP